MNIFKNLGRMLAGGPKPGSDVGLYYYVRCHFCKEVVRIRLNPMNDFSHPENENGQESPNFFARKVIVGQKCYRRMEAEFVFAPDKKLISKEVTGGVFVDEKDFLDYTAQEAANAPANTNG
jgi:hypothetical protein